MNTDSAILLVIAEQRQMIAALEAQVAGLTEENQALRATLDAAQTDTIQEES